MLIISVLLWLLVGYAAACTLYLLIFSWAGAIRKNRSGPSSAAFPESSGPLHRMAVLLPSYREDAVILESARMALEQTYPSTHYDVVVIADSLMPATLQQLAQLPIRVIEVAFEKSTKAKALAVALGQLPDRYDVAVILDADNWMAPDCLVQLNQVFAQGYQAVQGHRTAKNFNTSLALLDAVSEEINNHIFRKGHRVLGLPAALIGSGMAFNYTLLKELLPHIQVINGVDREIELQLAQRRITVAYAEHAHIFDEKVATAAVMERQRTRWLAAQWRVLSENAGPGLKALFGGNAGYADKIIQQALLPRVLLLGMMPMLLVLGALAGLTGLVWFTAVVFGLLILALYLGIPSALKARIGWSELIQLPAVVFRFLRSLFKMRQARDRFLHTPHGSDPVTTP